MKPFNCVRTNELWFIKQNTYELFIYKLYIYIYIYLLINYLPAFTVTRKKEKKREKNPARNKRSRYLESSSGEKRKNIIGQKERKGQPRHTSWKKSRDKQSVGQKKNKTHRQFCNATITRLLNMSGANYKINLNCESEFSY